jgi:hypothetical protein
MLIYLYTKVQGAISGIVDLRDNSMLPSEFPSNQVLAMPGDSYQLLITLTVLSAILSAFYALA